MSVSKDVIKQCLIRKQREVDEAVIVSPTDFRLTGCVMSGGPSLG